MDNNQLAPVTESEKAAPCFEKKIGKTLYSVVVHFSETSTEDVNDKVMRLIQNDIARLM